MNKKGFWLFGLLLLCFSFLGRGQQYGYVVQLKAPESVSKHLRSIEYPGYNALAKEEHLYLVSDSTFQILRKKDKITLFERIVPAEIRKTPNDVHFTEQWSLNQIDAPGAWDLTTGGTTSSGRDIVVAVVDKGYDVDHIDLAENILVNRNEIPDDGRDNDGNGYVDDYRGYNVASQNDQHDIHFHGTAVAGLIGGVGDNNFGISGVNWNIKIMPVSAGGPGLFTSDIYMMYEYVIQQRELYNDSNGEQGAYVVAINGSLGIQGAHPDSFPVWCNYLERMGDQGILYVASTTNENWDVDTNFDMPLSCVSPYLIGVTNSDQNDQKPFDAGYGRESIDLAAPGESTFSLRPNDQYGSFSGTSASSPHVAGAIGLLYSIPCKSFEDYVMDNPEAGSLMVKDYLLNGVDQTNELNNFTKSGGRLNVLKSMQFMQAGLCEDQANTPQVEIVRIQPTITTNQVLVEFNKPKNESAEILIFNLLGQVIYKLEISAGAPGIEAIQVSDFISSFGTYFLSLRSGKEIDTQRFIFGIN